MTFFCSCFYILSVASLGEDHTWSRTRVERTHMGFYWCSHEQHTLKKLVKVEGVSMWLGAVSRQPAVWSRTLSVITGRQTIIFRRKKKKQRWRAVRRPVLQPSMRFRSKTAKMLQCSWQEWVKLSLQRHHYTLAVVYSTPTSSKLAVLERQA